MATTATGSNAKKIFVGNLDFSVTESELKLLFESTAGPVEGVNIRRDRETKRPRGFAFITFVNAADAQTALDTMQNCIHRGRTLTIKPQIARGTKGNAGAGSRKKKVSVWGDKSQDGWFTPTAATSAETNTSSSGAQQTENGNTDATGEVKQPKASVPRP